ncbi:ABC transporter permease subunit [Bacillus sp. CGMCC 1.16607]|uniref:ABC transporter permease subunit n=1 Tax=Bacillus sp. CGMCC 1.16607 TaxID=3351842 RepID=UPI00363B7326
MYSIRILTQYLFSLLFLFVLAAIPLVFFTTFDQPITFQPQKVVLLIKDFLVGIVSKESFYYNSGRDIRFFPTDMVKLFTSSYLYLASAGSIVIILSFLFGIYLWKVSVKYLHGFLSLFGMIPDFIFILMLQLLVTFIYKCTGIKTIKVASLSISEPAIFLPILTLVVIPFVYLIRSLNEKTFEVITEDYIQTAIAKGLSKPQIYFHHITSNVLPFFKADLHKVTSIMISNLFVVEYLYNTKGITTMLFQHQVQFGYQYNLVILCFLTLIVLYLVVYFSFRLLIWIVERVIKYV